MLRLQKFIRMRFCSLIEKKEILDYSRPNKQNSGADQGGVNCLVIHPVFHPNKGPDHELYMAEEAIGLAKALFWNVTKGPFWQEQFTKDIRASQGREEETGRPLGRSAGKRSFMKCEGKAEQPDMEKQLKEEGWELSNSKSSQFKDGEYVYTPIMKGVYYKGGMFMNLDSSESDDDLYNEWKNKIIRKSIAKSSMLKVKKIQGTHFFSKGKVQFLGEYILQNNVNALFINHELSPLQNRNLERTLYRILNGKEVNFISKAADPGAASDYDTDALSSESDIDVPTNLPKEIRTIKIFDRYTMILQIFAKRAQSGLAKLQVELSFLKFARTKLIRSGTAFQSLTSIFQGDLMSAKEMNLEVVSAKQRNATGKLSGSGETQLEIQRRLINDKEAKIKKLIESENSQRRLRQHKRQNLINSIPTIALIGYTNAGKSAVMNCLVQSDVVESRDSLFQTLATTSKRIKLVSGQKAILLDTIGFISDLPHDLIESFKSTLEEVSQADLVLHIRDISNPCTELQRETVLQVLRDLKFDQNFYNNKMIEVWNKIDLLTKPLDYLEIERSDYPVVPISALMKTNMKSLLSTIEEKSNALMGKRMYHLKHSLQAHGDRIRWIFKNGNISGIENEKHDEELKQDGSFEAYVEFDVLLDEVVYSRYLTTFEIEKEKKIKNMPPPDWHIKKRN